MTGFFVGALITTVVAGFTVAFIVLGFLYTNAAREEHREGRHRTAFWGFGLVGLAWFLIPVFALSAGVSKVLS